MRHIKLFAILIATMVTIFSCQKTDELPIDSVAQTLTAYAPGSGNVDETPDTKVGFTELASGNIELDWQVNDVITIYNGGTFARVGNWKVKSVASDGKATFVKVDGENLVAGTNCVAVYPASTKALLNETNNETITTQNQKANDNMEHLDDNLRMRSTFQVGSTMSFFHEVAIMSVTFKSSEVPTVAKIALQGKSYTTNLSGFSAGVSTAHFILPPSEGNRIVEFTVNNKEEAAVIRPTTEPFVAGKRYTWNTTSTAPANVPVTGITLDKATLTLKPDEFYDPQLVATITPSNATNKKIEWSSSNDEVVYIDNTSGDIMTPGGIGQATITATTEDGGFTATCKVTVAKSAFTFADDALIFVEGVSGAAPESYILKSSSSATLYFARYWDRERYNYPNAKWSSSDPDVVSVSNETGSEVVIEALKVGTATITATDEKGNELTLDITVKAFEFADDARIFVEGVSGAAPESYTLKSSSSATLYFARYWDKERYNYPNAKWSSSNSSIVSVSKTMGSEIVIVPRDSGEATITAADESGNKITIIIYVSAPPKIGDFYYSDHSWSTFLYKSKEVIGVVWNVDNETKVGNIVSLDQSYTSWGPDGVVTGVDDEFHGLWNMALCMKTDNPKYFFAFKWCHNKNGSAVHYESNSMKLWYLPAFNELGGDLRSEVVLDKINESLKKVRGTEVDGIYWSSTESMLGNSKANAMEVSMDGSPSISNPKCVAHKVIAFMKFKF